jgi:hypothetical protein
MRQLHGPKGLDQHSQEEAVLLVMYISVKIGPVSRPTIAK